MANNNPIFNAVIAGAGGANQERWIQSGDSSSYAAYRTAVEAVATAVDAEIPAGNIGASQQALMQSICQGVFAGRYPQAESYSAIALSIVALYTQLATGLQPDVTPGGTFDPIFQQYWLDTSKLDGGNGSIGTPYNTWAEAVAAAVQGNPANPSVIYFAQEFDASGTPIPNYQISGHGAPMLKLQGIMQSGYYYAPTAGNTITGLIVEAQDGDDFVLNLVDLILIGATLPAGMTLALTGENSIISSVYEDAPSVSGLSSLINCSVNSIGLPSFNLRMQGGTVDSSIEVAVAVLDDVEFLSSADFRYASSMVLTNCRFQAGAQILCSASQSLTVDLDTYGAMIAAGVTFPDTDPTLTIVPSVRALTIVPTLGTLNNGPSYTTFTVNSGTIPALAGLEVGDSVTAAMRNDHDADGYSLVQASVRAADSITLTFLKIDVGTIDVGLVTLDLGIIEVP